MPNLITKGKAIAGQYSLVSGVMWFSGAGAPTNAVTGAGVAEKGSFYIRTSNGAVYYNTGTKASPTWSLMGTVGALATNNIFVGSAGGVATDVALSGHATIVASGAMTLAETIVKYDEIAIPSADIVSAAAGKLSNAAGQILVAAPAAGKAIELISAVLIYDYAGAAYGGGGDLTIRYSGGTILSATVTAANSFGAAADKVAVFQPLDTAGGILLTTAAGLNLVAASVPFTLGSATGVGRVKLSYRIHTTGL
jgi:hypothetical protein